MANKQQHGRMIAEQPAQTQDLLDLTDPEALRKAIVISEILNRKY